MTRPGIKSGPARERRRCHPSTRAVIDMYRTAWYPESSCENDANLKEFDRQWIAQELINFIRMLFRAVQFDTITSKCNSVPSFCYRYAQLGTNCSLHKGMSRRKCPISQKTELRIVIIIWIIIEIWIWNFMFLTSKLVASVNYIVFGALIYNGERKRNISKVGRFCRVCEHKD